jgi:hypothetical protein
MAIQAQDIATLHTYAQGVMHRANHHAGNVEAIALALIGGVIWRHKPGTIQIRGYNGSPANMLWWTSAATGISYAFAYNHHSDEIELRDRTVRGAVLHSFTNATSLADVQRTFATL